MEWQFGYYPLADTMASSDCYPTDQQYGWFRYYLTDQVKAGSGVDPTDQLKAGLGIYPTDQLKAVRILSTDQ